MWSQRGPYAGTRTFVGGINGVRRLSLGAIRPNRPADTHRLAPRLYAAVVLAESGATEAEVIRSPLKSTDGRVI